jgi:RNA-binding protein YhbY
MTKRRVHSSIDKLPAGLRDVLTRMVVDNEWPQDFAGEKKGKPRFEDIVVYCKQKNSKISKSAVGRFAENLKTISIMKSAGLIARNTMAGLTEENAPKTQKAAAEMATALLLKFMVEGEGYTSKQLKEISQAVRDCAQVSIKVDQYIREQVEEKIAAAAKSTKSKLTKAGVDRKLIQEIIDEHLGVVKS